MGWCPAFGARARLARAGSVVDRRIRHDRWAGALVGLPIVVAVAIAPTGCSSSADPLPTASTSGSTGAMTSSGGTSTTSGQPTLAVPTTAVPTTDPGIPPAAREDSIEGAQEFVKYFLHRANESWTRPDSSLLAPLCTAASKTCMELIGKAREYEAKGLQYDGTPYRETPVIGTKWASGSATVRANGGQPQGRVVDRGGATVLTVDASQIALVFELIRDGTWRVLEIKTEVQPP